MHFRDVEIFDGNLWPGYIEAITGLAVNEFFTVKPVLFVKKDCELGLFVV